MALQAVEERRSGHLDAFGQYALELETSIGAKRAERLIERAERELASCNQPTATTSIGE